MSTLTRLHHRRLREIYRSAGWPCLDPIEIELLAAGLVERVPAPDGRDWLRVTPAGIDLLAQTLQRNRSVLDRHELLVERVAHEQLRLGRLAWRGLSLRAKVDTGAPLVLEPVPLLPELDAPRGTSPGRWCMARPDVYSVRHTSVEAYLDPVVHEIKVRRADLQSDLRHEAKRAAYLALSRECYYVIAAGIAEPDEIPPEFGVIVAQGEHFDGPLLVARAAPKRQPLVDGRLPFGVWMALARAVPVEPPLDDGQSMLGG
jgi:hypothetical protein